MANNRLYIVDTVTGDKFMLCKSLGDGWGVFMSERGEELDTWLSERDLNAANQNGYTTLNLITENRSTINSTVPGEQDND